MKTSIPRLRRIRFKDGRAPLEVLRPAAFDPDPMRQAAEYVIGQCAEMNAPMGIAIVAWTSTGWTMAKTINGTQMPGILVPDLVRNVLLGIKIEGWTLDTINGQ